MNDKVINSLIELCVDICRRNGKNKLIWFGDKNKSLNYNPANNEMVFTVHRWFANKSCPGNYLYNRLEDIANTVTKRLGGSAYTPSIPTSSGGSSNLSITDVAKEVIQGKWGNGNDRKNNLERNGYNYNEVQNEVNRILGKSSSVASNLSSNNNVAKSSITDIAKQVIQGKYGNGDARKQNIERLGYNYAEVQKEVNRLLGCNTNNNVSSATNTSSHNNNITQVARDVINGKYGNGDVRKRNLESKGYNYSQVQAEVNRLLGVKSSNSSNTSQNNKKSIDTIAREVIQGKWGNGDARKRNLENAGYNYREVQNRVNQLL